MPERQITPRLLKIKQAAVYLNCSPWKIRNLVQQGGIPYLPGEGSTAPWTFDIRDLDAYIESAEVRLCQRNRGNRLLSGSTIPASSISFR
jgi:excisionase family DNA binding protein